MFPVAPVVEKAGTFVDWEGRNRPFAAVLRGTNAMPDVRVLHMLADEMGVDLGLPDVAAARAEIAELGLWDGDRAAFAPVPAPRAGAAGCRRGRAGHWRMLLDAGRLQDGEPYLAGTARTAVARLSAATAAAIGVADGDCRDRVAPTAARSRCRCVVTEMPDGVVWLPTNAAGLRRCAATWRRSRVAVRLAVAPADRAGGAGMSPRRRARVAGVPGFGNDPWWLVVAKAVAIFVFLVLMTLFAIWSSAASSRRMQLRIGPNRVGP